MKLGCNIEVHDLTDGTGGLTAKRTRKPRQAVPLERDVQKSILAFLALRGILAWRQNTGSVVREYRGKSRLIRFGMSGMPDILGCLPGGRLLAIEVKRPGNKPTDEQFATLANLTKAGALAFWASSVYEVQAILEAGGY